MQDYEDDFTELVLSGQKNGNDEDIKKYQLVQNEQNIEIIDTVFAISSHHIPSDMINKIKKECKTDITQKMT
jgi:hypothetical protein